MEKKKKDYQEPFVLLMALGFDTILCESPTTATVEDVTTEPYLW